MNGEPLKWLWITAAVELVAQHMSREAAREFLLVELEVGRIHYRYRGKPIYRGLAFPLSYFWLRLGESVAHEITPGNAVIRKGPALVRGELVLELPSLFESDNEPDETVRYVVDPRGSTTVVELPLVQLKRDDILRRLQESGYLPHQQELALQAPVSQESAELDSTPVKQSVLNPVAQVAEAMARTAKSGSAIAWIIKLHPDDWNVVTAGKFRQEAARQGATLSDRAFQHALAKMRTALARPHDKG